MTIEPNWDEINKKKEKQILKSMCINIAFQNIPFDEVTSKAGIKQRIEYAREVYYEIQKSKFYIE